MSSRKASILLEERRRAMGANIHAASTISELKELVINALEQAVVMDKATRERCANDILDERYDLLLLP